MGENLPHPPDFPTDSVEEDEAGVLHEPCVHESLAVIRHSLDRLTYETADVRSLMRLERLQRDRERVVASRLTVPVFPRDVFVKAYHLLSEEDDIYSTWIVAEVKETPLVVSAFELHGSFFLRKSCRDFGVNIDPRIEAMPSKDQWHEAIMDIHNIRPGASLYTATASTVMMHTVIPTENKCGCLPSMSAKEGHKDQKICRIRIVAQRVALLINHMLQAQRFEQIWSLLYKV